jgi:hypothetical protein
MSMTPSGSMRRLDRQVAMYEQVAGAITMSHWFARSLAEQSGMSPTKIHVVHPGLSAGRTIQGARQLRDRPAPRRKLLLSDGGIRPMPSAVRAATWSWRHCRFFAARTTRSSR